MDVEMETEEVCPPKDMEEEDDDIYGDLESSIFTSSSRRVIATNPDDAARIDTLLKENQDLKTRVRDLSQQSKTLLKNISSLYLTATKVIEKKNFIINELQSKLKDSVLSRGHSSNFTIKEIEDILNQCQEACIESQYKVCVEEIKRAINENAQRHNKQSCKTKSFKFGNMSWHFVNYDSMCERFEQIEFPRVKTVKSESNTGNTICGSEDKINRPSDLKELLAPEVKTSLQSEPSTEKTSVKKGNSDSKLKIDNSRPNNRHEGETQTDPTGSNFTVGKVKTEVASAKSRKCNSDDASSCKSESMKSNSRYERENKEGTNERRSSSRDYRRSERINKGFPNRHSRDERLYRKCVDPRGYSHSPNRHARSNSKNSNVPKGDEDRRRDVRDRSSRLDRSNIKTSYPYSENTRRDSTRSSKRHRRDIS